MTHDLDDDLLASVGMRREQFGPMTAPATVIGQLTQEVQKLTGMGDVPVIAVAGHDTASAVAAVPAANGKFAYLSSGTWSLMGIETPEAIINDKSFAKNFTNEGGIEGTTRFLKNICGMWIYERCRQEWPEAKNMSHGELQQGLLECEAFRSIINPDDPMFANPDSMVNAINGYCTQTDSPCHAPRPNIAAASSTLAGTEISADIHVAERVCRFRDRPAAHHRRVLDEQIPQPVHRQLMRSDCARRSARGHGHRQYHVAGQGMR
jgi:sugar (pentulose or hexulose) kinase